MQFIRVILTCVLIAGCCLAAQASNRFQIQISVWNQTPTAIVLHCHPSDGVSMDPQTFSIAPDDSPPIMLNTDHYGTLVRCYVDGTLAAFSYTAITPNREHVAITPQPSNQPNFQYDSAYPGALIFAMPKR